MGTHEPLHKACCRLRTGRVALLAGDRRRDAASLVCRMLKTTGLDDVEMIGEAQLPAIGVPPETLVVALDMDTLPWLDLVSSQDGTGISWLRASLDDEAGSADVGPFFPAGRDACYRCFRNVHLVALPGSVSNRCDALDEKVWASLIAREIIDILSLPGFGLTGRSFRRIELPNLRSRLLHYPRLLGCSCSGQHGRIHSGFSKQNGNRQPLLVNTPAVYEDYIEQDAKIPRGVRQSDVLAQTDEVAREPKRFPSSEQIALYRGDIALTEDVFQPARWRIKEAPGPVTCEKLAILASLTAGVRETGETVMRRWAPTAGNLGSVELFIVNRSTVGLDAGYYFYAPKEHALARFRRRTAVPPEEFMGRVLGLDAGDLPESMFIFTAAFPRVYRKYRSFGYRLVHLDAGCAAGQLHAVARGLNVYARTMDSLADDLIQKELNLDRAGDFPTLVIAVSGKPPRRRWNPTPSRAEQSALGFSRSRRDASEFRDLDLASVTGMLIQDSLSIETQPFFHKDEFRDCRRESRTNEDSEDRHLKAVRLPNPLRSRVPLGEVLASRRSVRSYDQKDVGLSEISTILSNAESDPERDGKELCACMKLNYFLLASHVEGLEPGIYKYAPSRSALLRVGPAPTTEEKLSLFVQPEFTTAPMLILVAGNIAAACNHHGARGHRTLLQLAGTSGSRLWMSSVGLGLSCCLVAGIIPDSAKRIFRLGIYNFSSLLGLATGHLSADGEAIPFSPLADRGLGII
jgi:SagB-type dehydrogenase family enzyme